MADPQNLNVTISATDETKAAFAAVKRSMEQTATTAQRMGAEVQRSQGGFKGLTTSIQQAGFQIGDFATQVASGGSAVTAFVQQGSQLLGMFGMFGALAGAGLAIAGVAYKMYEAGDAAEKTRDAVSGLVDEIKKLNEEAAKAGGGVAGVRALVMLEDLRAEYDLLVQSQQAAQAQMQGVGAGEMASAVTAVNDVELARTRSRIEELQKLISEYEKVARQEQEIQERIANQRKRGEDAAAARAKESRDAEEAERNRLKAADQFARETERWNQRNEQTMASIRAEQERYNKSLDDQARRLREQIDPNVAYASELERIGELLRTNRISADEYTAAAEQAAGRIYRQTSQTTDITRELGFTFSSAFEDAIIKGQRLRNVLGGIAQDIARIVLRQTVTSPIAGLLSGVVSSFAGSISGLFGGAATSSAKGPVELGLPGFGGARASGGPVTAGMAYLVGEEGPELFVPRASGSIVPNGAGGLVVNQTINVQAGVAQTVRAEMLAMLPRFKRETIDAVADARQRGGRFAAAMGT